MQSSRYGFWTVAILAAFATSCARSEDDGSVAITDHNDLGIVTLDTVRYDARDNHIVELRGLDANGNIVASMKRQTGVIAELGGRGTEITISVGGTERSNVTRELGFIRLPVQGERAQQFLELAAVSSALAREAIAVTAQAQNSTDETPFFTSSCNSSDLNTSPLAKQCCDSAPGGSDWLTFIDSTGNGNSVSKARNPWMTACKAADGQSSCSGSACTYGPNGFAKPVVTSAGAYYGRVTTHRSCPSYYCPTMCQTDWFTSPQTPEFGDVTGTFPTGWGCCGNGSGPCVGGGCSLCAGSPPNDAGAGEWD